MFVHSVVQNFGEPAPSGPLWARRYWVYVTQVNLRR